MLDQASHPWRPSRGKRSGVRIDDRQNGPPELLFCNDLEGYGWCVRKGGYLNVGIGRRDSRDFATHVRKFMALLEANGALKPGAPSNGAATPTSPPASALGRSWQRALIVGDSAGLAYPESGEGILPAIASGRLAAETLVSAGGRHTLSRISRPTRVPLDGAHPRPRAPRRRFARRPRPSAEPCSDRRSSPDTWCSIAGSSTGRQLQLNAGFRLTRRRTRSQ